MNARLTALAGMTLPIFFSIFGCGKLKEEASSYRNRGLSVKGDDLQSAPSLNLSGTFENGKSTSQRQHSLTARFSAPARLMEANGLSAGAKITILFSLRDPDDQIVLEQTAEARLPLIEASWNFNLSGKEGLYTAEVHAVPPSDGPGLDLAPWKAQVELDTTQPTLAFEARLEAISDEGSRKLTIAARVSNETEATCQEAIVQNPSFKDSLPIKLNVRSWDKNARVQNFESEAQSLPNMTPSNTLVQITCIDAAGNQTELTQPISSTGSRGISLRARADALLGRPIGSAEAPVAFVNGGLLSLKIDLLDSLTAIPHTAPVIEAEKSSLRIYVSETPSASAEDLIANKNILWNQPYAPTIRLPVPATYAGAHPLFVSLLQRDVNLSRDILLGTVPLTIYVDRTAPSLSWDQPASFEAAVEKKLFTVKTRIQIDGAPLRERPLFEYSLDNKIWVSLPEQALKIDGASLTFTFAYPLAIEAPLRLRFKASDLAGNSTISAISPQIVGRAGIQLAVSAAERNACTSQGLPGSRLHAWLASSFSCKKADISGEPSGTSYVAILWQNRGQVSPQFYATSQLAEGLAYKVIADGEVVAVGRFSPPDLFRLSSSETRLLHFPTQDAWLSSRKIEIVFDAEVSDAYATTNACYPTNARFPSVIIQNLDQGQSLRSSFFACDQDFLVSP